MMAAQDEFQRAQQAALARWGVDAAVRRVPVASLGGHAQVLECGEGPPVVLLPGAGTPAAMYAPLLARLEGFRLYAVDLPGFGPTDAPSGLAGDLRTNIVRMLTETMDGLGLERAAVIGSSFGGLSATWFALDQPGRVARLIHLGCPAVALGTAAPLPMRLIATPGVGRLLMRLRGPSPDQVAELSKAVGEHPLDPEIAAVLLAAERLPQFEPTLRAVLRQLLWLGGPRRRYVLDERQLSELVQPLLVVWGADDPFGAPSIGARIASIVPDGKYELVPGGHAPWLQHSEPIAAHVASFLQRADVSAPRMVR